MHDPRGSARGRRLNLPTCAHPYIYIYTRLASISSLFFIPLSSGVVVATPLPLSETRRWWSHEWPPEAAPSSTNADPPSGTLTSGACSLFCVRRPLPLDCLIYELLSCRSKRQQGGDDKSMKCVVALGGQDFGRGENLGRVSV